MTTTPATLTRILAAPPALRTRLFLGPEGLARQLEHRLQPYALRLTPHDEGVSATGDELALSLAEAVLDEAAKALEAHPSLEEKGLRAVAAETIDHVLKHDLALRLTGLARPLRPLNLAQLAFASGLIAGEHELTFALGPTGTGKTHIAIAAGLHRLAAGKAGAVILTRPHILMEGEIVTAQLRHETRLDDQLTPLEDEVYELLGHEEAERLIHAGRLHLLPIGRLRGRTFSDAYIVIDDAQNLTVPHMRMALSRMGRNTRMVVCGDPTRTELRSGEPSGLDHILHLIEGAQLAHIHRFTRREIIRNRIVAEIEALYERDESSGPRAVA